MPDITLQNPAYRAYTEGFQAWMTTLGYSPSTARMFRGMLQEFLGRLEGLQIGQITTISPQVTQDYVAYLAGRKNSRREGALSAGHVNRHIQMLEKFREYMGKMHQVAIPMSVERIREEDKTEWVVLNTEDIARLYHSTDDTPYGVRDRAMLAVYYGCGLRKSEGEALDVDDVLFERGLLYVRKPKNGHQRYVPMTRAVQGYLRAYLCEARPLLIGEGSDTDALWISQRGGRMTGQMHYLRLKALGHRSGLQQEIGLHTLRHSVATHLLERGMPLESIALFLGHRCLDSTQIYTHHALKNQQTHTYGHPF